MRTHSARQTSKSNTEWSTPWLLIVIVVWAWREIQNLQGYLKLDCQMIKEMRFSRAQSNRGIAGFALVWYRRQTITCVEWNSWILLCKKKLVTIHTYVLVFKIQLGIWCDVEYFFINYEIFLSSYKIGWTFTFNTNITNEIFWPSTSCFLEADYTSSTISRVFSNNWWNYMFQ